MWKNFNIIAAGVGVAMLSASPAVADTISPVSFVDKVLPYGSTTLRKTVVIESAPPTSALLDVMFVFDVTGSMGGAITAAKTSASQTIAGLGGFGNLQTGSGWYSDPLFNGVHVDLNGGNTGAASGINDMWDTGNCIVAGVFVGCGGDAAEVGYAGVQDAANNASWRTGSNRVIVALGDQSFKNGPGGETQVTAQAALNANNVDLVGVSFGSAFDSSITGLGGTVVAGSTDPDDIATIIKDLVSTTFENYSSVSVDTLGTGLPEFAFSAVCVSADTGACVGDEAVGTYDRSIDRTFEFDVTFTDTTGVPGTMKTFETYALVDGGIVATETDKITVTPLPGSVAMMGAALAGMGYIAYRRNKKTT